MNYGVYTYRQADGSEVCHLYDRDSNEQPLTQDAARAGAAKLQEQTPDATIMVLFTEALPA